MLDSAQLNEIRRLIAEFSAGRLLDPSQEREAVAHSQSLPALEDWSAFAAIAGIGTLIWVDRDPPYATRDIEEPRVRRLVLFEASKRYPTLASLCPTRPANAGDCIRCSGTGRLSLDSDDERIQHRGSRGMETPLVCSCGGLGWVPKDEVETTERAGTPASVVLALRAMSIIIACEFFVIATGLAARQPGEEIGAILYPMGALLAISASTLAGLNARNRLLWQWGRLVGMIGGTLLLIWSIAALSSSDSPPLTLIVSFVVAISICLWIVAIALGTSSARAHFDLRCPACGRLTDTAADFLFAKAKCGRCGCIW